MPHSNSVGGGVFWNIPQTILWLKNLCRSRSWLPWTFTSRLWPHKSYRENIWHKLKLSARWQQLCGLSLSALEQLVVYVKPEQMIPHDTVVVSNDGDIWIELKRTSSSHLAYNTSLFTPPSDERDISSKCLVTEAHLCEQPA